MNINDLIQEFKSRKSEFPDDFNLRIHRSLSWLKKAEQTEDNDIKFIALWVAFNAVYAREIGAGFSTSEKSEFRRFLNAVCRLDTEKEIYNIIWQKYSGSIRLLLDNKFIFQPFWDAHNRQMSQSTWQGTFEDANRRVRTALANTDTDTVLAYIFSRLYTLRNQIIHGGATHNSNINRPQIKDANAIMSSILPETITIMMNNHNATEWGKPFYPPVSENGE